MKHGKWIVGIGSLVALTGVILIGLRDIGRFHLETAGQAADGSGEGVPVVRLVSNPQPVPAFTVEGLDGRPLSTSDWIGKVVLINFWATWCPPCVAEIPDLVRLQAKYRDRVVIVGLSQDTGLEDVKAFVQRMQINYPVAIAGPEIESKFGGIFGLPTSFVLDTEGRVVQKHVGLRDPAVYENAIRVLLDLPVNARVERVEDTGQVMLSNAQNATELPGVDLSKLTPEQKRAALRRFNEESCTCGCGLTLAQCRINDSSCEVSRETATRIVSEMLSPAPASGQP